MHRRAFLALSLAGMTIGAERDPRARMLGEVARDFRDTAALTGLSAMPPAIAAALRAVPRDAFVDADDRDRAWINRPLDIGHGQTISQPFIVALMTALAEIEPGALVLEIGTGSGYQAAVLAELGAQVVSIEIIAALAARARKRLARHGYATVEVQHGDGNYGWPARAPYDAILVTAGGRLPPALVAQLKPGGRLILPLRIAPAHEELMLYRKLADGTLAERAVLPVRFVPLTGDN
jgi:protein-L-isoaspartate(D-aspartate) O-methyltransferase